MMYLEPVLSKKLQEVKDQFYGEMPYRKIISILNKHFKQDDFIFHLSPRVGFGLNDFAVAGYYDQEFDLCHIKILVSKHYQYLPFESSQWTNFHFAVLQVCCHEAIHQTQWQFREYDSQAHYNQKLSFSAPKYKEKIYLADPDEIEAYAHDIAMEIKFYYPKKDPVDILKHINRFKKIWSFFYYKHTFDDDHWITIKSKLLRKTYKWLGT